MKLRFSRTPGVSPASFSLTHALTNQSATKAAGETPAVQKRFKKRKAANLDGFAASVLTVAGGFGGSGDDQSSLGHRGQRNRRNQRDGGGEAQKLGHCGLPELCFDLL